MILMGAAAVAAVAAAVTTVVTRVATGVTVGARAPNVGRVVTEKEESKSLVPEARARRRLPHPSSKANPPVS